MKYRWPVILITTIILSIIEILLTFYVIDSFVEVVDETLRINLLCLLDASLQFAQLLLDTSDSHRRGG